MMQGGLLACLGKDWGHELETGGAGPRLGTRFLVAMRVRWLEDNNHKKIHEFCLFVLRIQTAPVSSRTPQPQTEGIATSIHPCIHISNEDPPTISRGTLTGHE